MQRLLSLKKASQSFTKSLSKANLSPSSSSSSSSSSSLFHSHPYKTFSSIAKSTPTPQNKLLNSAPTYPFHRSFPWRSQHTLTGKVRGFILYPVLVKRFLLGLSNTHLRAALRIAFDSRVWFLRAQNSKWGGSNFGFLRRRWSWKQISDDMVISLIVANIAVFMLWRISDRRFMADNFMISLENFRSGRVHTLITSAFSHIEFQHFFSNMLVLYFFGMNIGRTFGPQYLLKLYLAGAIGGSVFYLVHKAYLARSSTGQGLWMMDPSRIRALGASGAVNAIMLLDIFLNPRATIYLNLIIPIPAMLLGAIYIANDIWRMMEGDTQISGSTHLGGAAVAAIAWARIRRGRF